MKILYKNNELLFKRIDIHSHILPDIDDGSNSFEESIEMLKIANKQGFYIFIATPHYSSRYKNVDINKMIELCKKLESKAQECINLEIKIYLGQEILYSVDIIEKLAKGEALTLANSNYVLIEFIPQITYSEILRIVREFASTKYIPILAHIERYDCLRFEERIKELSDMGAFFQINYTSISGKWYLKKTRWCRKMLKRNNIHFIATDMHNLKIRSPETNKATLWIYRNLDFKYINDILFKNALKIINKQKI